MTPRISVVIPARDEGDITPVVSGITSAVPAEVIIVVDAPSDTTTAEGAVVVVSQYPPGPANAIRYGIDHAGASVIVVMMADGSDDPSVLPKLVSLVADGGAAVACASRYAPGGRQAGGPLIKRILSRAAGLSLYHLAHAGTHDATNAYKAYDAKFLKQAVIESRHGFEMGIEMVAKATRMKMTVAEVPVTWRDRTSGESHFRLRRWLPHYLRWWLLAMGYSSLRPKP